MHDLTGTLQRLDLTGARAVHHALHIAGAVHRLRVAHLIAGLLATDGSFVLRRLRGTRIDRADLVRQVNVAVGARNGADPVGPVRILSLAGTLARPGVRINTQHLLAAILLADGNPVAAYLANAGIDRHLFVRQRFAHLFAVDDALRELAPEAAAGLAGDTLGQSAAVLHAWAAAAAPRAGAQPTPVPRPAALHPPVPRAPQPAPSEPDPELPERTAKHWLRKLIPSQAERYAKQRFVEIDSRLIPGRRYRIHQGRQTEIYDRGTRHSRSCLQLRNWSLPPTDRVIAEYFLIQGDERAYLDTANILRRGAVALDLRSEARRH